MSLLKEVQEAWGWSGIHPSKIVGENDFGNLMIKDDEGRYWSLCREDLYCKIVAHNQIELDELSQNQEFLGDWYMGSVVADANAQLGPLRPGYKYCLKIPGVLGGEYGGENLAMISLQELVKASGYIAHQIEDLPDGARVRLTITD